MSISKSRLSAARERTHLPGGVNRSDTIIVSVSDVDCAVRSDGDADRPVETCCGSAPVRIAAFILYARDRRRLSALRVNARDDVRAGFGDDQCAVRRKRDLRRGIQILRDDRGRPIRRDLIETPLLAVRDVNGLIRSDGDAERVAKSRRIVSCPGHSVDTAQGRSRSLRFKYSIKDERGYYPANDEERDEQCTSTFEGHFQVCLGNLVFLCVSSAFA